VELFRSPEFHSDASRLRLTSTRLGRAAGTAWSVSATKSGLWADYPERENISYFNISISGMVKPRGIEPLTSRMPFKWLFILKAAPKRSSFEAQNRSFRSAPMAARTAGGGGNWGKGTEVVRNFNYFNWLKAFHGGWVGIRTHGTLARTAVFKTHQGIGGFRKNGRIPGRSSMDGKRIGREQHRITRTAAAQHGAQSRRPRGT
jgi:hypothetical protein